MLKRTVLMAAGLLLSVSTIQAQTHKPVSGGELKLAISADISGTEPGVRRNSDSDTIALHVTEGLVGYREDLSIAPMLAKNYEISEDGKTYKFTLRDGIKFHNGSPLTSDEVVWTWQRILNPANEFQCLNWYDGSQNTKVEEVTAPDSQTVIFKLAEPSPLFLHYMANTQCITGILHPDSVNEKGEWLKPIGTGPFSFGEWRRDSYVRLDRFNDYTALTEPRDGMVGDKTPWFDNLWFMVVPDPATRRAALEAGDLDWITIDIADIDSIKKASDVAIETAQGLSWNVMLMQSKDPLLADSRIRKAIAHAIDMDSLVGMRTNGIGKPNPSAIPLSSASHDAAQDLSYGYDPEKARKLLSEAGYAGQPIKIQTNNRHAYMYDTAIVLQAMLASVGINAELEVLEWATQLERYNSGRFQLMSFRFSARMEPTLNYLTFLGDRNADPSNQWDNGEALVLLTQAQNSSDPERRQQIFDQLHALMIEDAPLVSLYNTPLVDAHRKNVTGVELTSSGKTRAWGVWKQD